jgi:Na+-transporting methylmalonyl-CoA/oxaloacetate decarboxylase gamma subunit
METTWANAVQVFVVGFGGVFCTLFILMFGVMLYSAIAGRISGMFGKKKEQKA